MSEALQVLKNRLARGEISISQYREIANEIESGVNFDNSVGALKKGATRLFEASAGAYKNIFGSNSIPYPTNESPFEVTKNFRIFGDCFESNSEFHYFSEICSIYYFAESSTVNFVPMGTSSEFSLILNSGQRIDFSGSSIIIKGRTNKQLSLAYSFLSKATFQQRLKIAIDQLENRGGILVDGVTITRDGYFRKGGTRISIRTAASNGNLCLGTYFGFGSNSSSNPYEVLAGETGTSILSNRVRFKVKSDTDVIFYVIKKLSE